jgi:signal transduction histidine kinase
MRKIYFLSLFSILITGAFAQVQPGDSLLKRLAVAADDSNKVNLLYSIGNVFENSEPEKAKHYIRMGGDLSKRINFTAGIQKYFRRISYVLIVQSQYDSVLYYNQQGLELAKRLKDTFAIGVSMFNMGVAYRFKADYENAVLYNLEGARILEGKGYSTIETSMYDGLQVLYMSLSQYEKAIMYGEKAIALGRKMENKNPLAVALNNLALSYMEVNRLENAKQVLQEAIRISKGTDNKSVEASALNNLGDIAIREGRFELLKNYGEQSEQIHREINSPEGLTVSILAMAIYYQSKKDFKKAKEFALAALKITEENNFLAEKSHCMKILSNISFSLDDFAAGYRYALESSKIDGIIFNESLAEKEAGMKVKFETEKKEILIKELEADKKVQQLSIRQKNTLNYILIAGGLSILIISLLAYRTYTQKQKLQQQRIIELETQQQLTATEAVLKGEEQERTRLAKDLHDGLGGMLSGIKFSFNTMKGNLIMTPENNQAFERSMDMLDSSIKEMRRVAHNMMPEALVKFGLDTALRDFCNDINKSGALEVSYQSLGLENAEIAQTTAITIYRIVQELINNTMKHAGAKTAIVQVTKSNERLSVTVEDDGQGFDTGILQKAKGMGWSNIQNRIEFLKGRLDVRSENGKGTSVHFELGT